MGSKNLKAIVLHGTSVADVDVSQAAWRCTKPVKMRKGLAEWSRYGTTVVTSWCNEVGALPTRNFSSGSFEGIDAINGQAMRKEIVVTDKGCFGCPSPCGKYSNMKCYNTQVEGPEYETIGLTGSNLGIADIQAVAEANRLADDLGIDLISAGSCIAWAMECYEKGIFTKADTDGSTEIRAISMPLFVVIKKIAYRQATR